MQVLGSSINCLLWYLRNETYTENRPAICPGPGSWTLYVLSGQIQLP